MKIFSQLNSTESKIGKSIQNPKKGEEFLLDWDGPTQITVLEVGSKLILVGRGDLKEESGNQLEISRKEFEEAAELI